MCNAEDPGLHALTERERERDREELTRLGERASTCFWDSEWFPRSTRAYSWSDFLQETTSVSFHLFFNVQTLRLTAVDPAMSLVLNGEKCIDMLFSLIRWSADHVWRDDDGTRFGNRVGLWSGLFSLVATALQDRPIMANPSEPDSRDKCFPELSSAGLRHVRR